MRKKIIPFMLITLFAFSSTVCAFSDVEEHWAKDSIEKLNDVSIIKGYEDNTFRPDNYMTRAEVATILNRMNGVTKESSKYIPDVTRQDWFCSEIRKAIQSGVMNGDENGYIHPNSFVTREEVVVMLSRAFDMKTVKNNRNFNYTDKDEISNWAKVEMTSFVTYDYITGYEDGTIRPKNNITRAEFTTILDRIFLEFVTSGIYSGDISGNAIIVEQNVALKDVTINGDLVIPEGIKETLKLKNVLVKGNLVLREKIDISEISCDGKIIHMYSDIDIDYDKYISEEYGIEFSIPNSAKVVEKWNETKINYKTENLLVIDIIQSGDYYLKNIETIAKEVIHNSENIYVISEKGNFNNIKYHLYKDTSAENDNNLLIIKRDNLVYKILFNKITEENLLDNVLGTIDFFDTENITERKNVIYKNSKLKIKFTYREGYIGVDDSYNTNSVYSGDAPIKLFIQVNTITDIQEYSFNEVAYMLKNLAREDGILIKSETLEVYNNDAIKMKIVSEEKLMYSLYVIDNNILYKFIFMSEEEIMNEIGEDLFKQVIASMQF